MRRRVIMIVAGAATLAALGLGGAAIAGGASDGEGSMEGGAEAERARAAALDITGGGTANAVERDSEHGATYEVEVTKPDGSTVDVRLDGSYRLVLVDADDEAADASDD